MRPLATLLSPLTSRYLYFPEETRLLAEETDLELGVGGLALRGWEVNPGQKHALVYYGGNGEGLDWLREPLSLNFPDHTSYLVAYRGYGASEGKPSERVLTTDALAVFEHAAARHRGSVDVVGRSLGSAVAVQVAARRRVRRLVLITPFDSAAALAAEHYPRLPVRLMLRDRWDSAAVAHRLRAPVLVVRAGRDKVVPPPPPTGCWRRYPPSPRCSTSAGAITTRWTLTRPSGRQSSSSSRPDRSGPRMHRRARPTWSATWSTRRKRPPRSERCSGRRARR